MIVGQIQKGEKMGRTLNEDDVLKEIDRWIGYLDEDMITRIKIGIKKIQSAQPEIIRCKDCKYNTGDYKCLNPDSFFVVPADDDFCSFAERREE